MEHIDTSNPESERHKPDLMNPDYVTTLGQPDREVVAAMRLPDIAQPPTLETAVHAMHRLPYIDITTLGRRLDYPAASDQRVVEDARFPMSRIVSIQGFKSWAGRGVSETGRAVGKDSRASAHVLHEYSQQEAPGYRGRYDSPTLQLFKDSDGGVWAFLDLDGAHRTGAAKLRGDAELVCNVVADDYDALPTVDFSVKEEILQQDKQRKGILGRVALKFSADRIVQASHKLEAERKERQPITTSSDGWDYI